MSATDTGRLPLSNGRLNPTFVGEEEDWTMMQHSRMLWFCGALMVIAVVLAVAGAGWITFLAPLGCAVMMAGMLWMMVGMGRRHH